MRKPILALLTFFLSISSANAALIITSPTITTNGTWHQSGNTVTLSGQATGTITSVTYACTANCNNSGTATGTTSWTSGTIYVNEGSNLVTVTSNLSGGGTETAYINLYRTIAGTTSISSFPYTLNFDSGPSSIEAKYAASGGATLMHQASQCWSGGCVKVVPSTSGDTYAALGGFQFSGTPEVIHVRYLIYFGPDYPSNLNQRHKHLIMHRYGNYPSDNSDDRNMIYIRHDGAGDLAFGACDNTACYYDTSSTHAWPSSSELLMIGDRTEQWISLEAVFDSSNHTVELYATTQDGVLDDDLIARHNNVHATSDPADDYFYALSILGGYIDLGTTASNGMYFLLDEVKMDTTHIGPPSGFIDSSCE